MAGDAPSTEENERRIAELEAVVAAQAELIERQAGLLDRHAELVERHAVLVELVESLREVNERLEARVAELERQLGQNSGNSGTPPSRDPAGERQRQAEERQRRAQAKGGGAKRHRGKQRGAKGNGLEMSATPDEIVDHRPDRCEGCDADLGDAPSEFAARQVIELPEVRPVVTEHRAHACRCRCGHLSRAAFPEAVRAPVSYGPRVRAVIAYLLGRQHLPTRRVAETMADLFGLPVSTGAVDSVYAEASRRLRGFIAALVALLRTLPVLHADETTDRIGTATCWLHVVSTGLYTLIHASLTRGGDAIDEAGVLRGYRGVVVHDRLAMYWKLKAKHGLCGAHLLRDLADVATVATQRAWASGLAALLVEINAACEDARRRGLRQLAPAHQRASAARYDALVADGLAANPDPPPGHKRSYYQRRKISGCFRSQHGAERFAHLRSYLSTTRKNGVPAIKALVRLFNGDPWMPPRAT
ncbi:MAG: IS66 family transposase [Actinobacteria bacterium]|nr:IS66 family transposase [Actinomycetota bacterium]